MERPVAPVPVFSVFAVLLAAAAAAATAAPRGAARADEGMWLFNSLPLAALREKHGFSPPAGWTERLMGAAVRLSSGGSGSFVSAAGLVMTNHHVGADALQKLSTPGRNLLEEGFAAESREDELRCPDLEVIALAEIEDVTERVGSAAPPELDAAARARARREVIATIAKESQDRTGLQSDVVALYQGGAYHLYRYRRWDDVRLVMAPPASVAFFGGDADNFEFPRFCLDVCFFRVYEDGKPLRPPHFLRFSRGGVKEGDLVFVAGHPGRTERANTVDHLRFLRDVEYPAYLERLARREIMLQQFSLEGKEEERMAREELFGVQNSRKALRGMLAGLLDPATLEAKALAEAELRAWVADHPACGATLDDWRRITDSRAAFRELRGRLALLEWGDAFWSPLFQIARSLVRLAEEKEKPNAERLAGYRDSDLERLELELFSPAPIYPEFETAKLADSLTALASSLGGDHPLVRLVLRGRSPAERASDLVAGTSLADVAARRALAAGGREAVKQSEDPMMVLARAVDPYARDLRRQFEDLIEGTEREAYGNIAKARFALHGTSVYPDATFTLRLALGVVKGWEEGGRAVPYATHLGGLYEKHAAAGGAEPYALPERWLAAREAVDPRTPFNFVSTADIIGGNSGSPVVDRSGALVGIIFDGNIHSLVLDLTYTDEKARAVSVAAEAIIEALRKVYGLGSLADEIVGEGS